MIDAAIQSHNGLKLLVLPSITFNVITIFPEAFPGALGISVVGRALHKKLWALDVIDLKNFKTNGRLDDRPYSGGPGMLIKPDVLGGSLDFVLQRNPDSRLIYLSASGAKFDQRKAKALSEEKNITLICGRFEGIDYRVVEVYKLEELSIGDYVLSGGEVAAMVVIDSCVRLVPGVVGNAQSTVCESFANECVLEYPQYTRPLNWRGLDVPDVLRSGDHAMIKKWQKVESRSILMRNRPDLKLEG